MLPRSLKKDRENLPLDRVDGRAYDESPIEIRRLLTGRYRKALTAGPRRLVSGRQAAFTKGKPRDAAALRGFSANSRRAGCGQSVPVGAEATGGSGCRK